MAVFGNRGKKRGRAAWSAGGGAISGATDSGGDSDSADGGGSGDERCSSSSRPKKRFIWPEVCCAGLGWAGLGWVLYVGSSIKFAEERYYCVLQTRCRNASR